MTVLCVVMDLFDSTPEIKARSYIMFIEVANLETWLSLSTLINL